MVPSTSGASSACCFSPGGGGLRSNADPLMLSFCFGPFLNPFPTSTRARTNLRTDPLHHTNPISTPTKNLSTYFSCPSTPPPPPPPHRPNTTKPRLEQPLLLAPPFALDRPGTRTPTHLLVLVRRARQKSQRRPLDGPLRGESLARFRLGAVDRARRKTGLSGLVCLAPNSMNLRVEEMQRLTLTFCCAQMVVMRWPVADCLHPLSVLELVRGRRSSELSAYARRRTLSYSALTVFLASSVPHSNPTATPATRAPTTTSTRNRSCTASTAP